MEKTKITLIISSITFVVSPSKSLLPPFSSQTSSNVTSKVEEDLVVEKSKIKQVSDDLNAVFDELM